MVKVLGIAGIPKRGGNTEIVVGEVLKACEQDGAEVELVSLTDFELMPCDGCRNCFDTGSYVIDDDIEKLILMRLVFCLKRLYVILSNYI